MVQNSLMHALENKNLVNVLAYSRFSPEVAREKRQAIVPVIIRSLSQAFNTDDFDEVTHLGSFLNDEMEIDFNLGAILLKDFDAYLKKQQILETLRAETPESLIQEQQEVALDLGPKFSFLRTFFSDSADTIDNILKSLVLNAPGQYGTPNALYRLYHLFDEKAFPKDEKDVYLLSTLRNSLSRDEKLTALDMTLYGYDLHRRHSDLRLDFIVSEILNRLDNLEDSRAVWLDAPEDLKAAFQAVRPEFKALMTGIDAFDADQFSLAAESFAQISSVYYLNQAKPYISHYVKTLQQFRGVYVPEDLLNEHSTLAAILVNPYNMSGSGMGSTLTRTELTFINRVGSTPITRSDQLSTHYGKTFRTNIYGTLNFNTLAIAPSYDYAIEAALPLPFSDIYGNIEDLQLISEDGEAPKLNVTFESGKTALFRRVAVKPNYPQIPDGRFSIQKELTTPSTGSEYILPIGSILELETAIQSPLQPKKNNRNLSVVYPVSGFLHHPAQPDKPQPIEGFYNPDLHTTNLVLKYPLPGDSGYITALARCHILSHKLLCGTHNQHNMRAKYAHLVAGTQTKESRVNSGSKLNVLINLLEENARKQQEREAATPPTKVEKKEPPAATLSTDGQVSDNPSEAEQEDSILEPPLDDSSPEN